MSENKRLAPLFGANIDPSAAERDEPFRRAQIADQNGLHLITIQDHPYNMRFFDTWTLLAALAMKTEGVHVGTNVISIPLRPPAMLAKMAATIFWPIAGNEALQVEAFAGQVLPAAMQKIKELDGSARP